MARRVFPSDPSVQRPGAPGANVRNAVGAIAVVFADAAANQLADIQDLNGNPVPGSTLIVDGYSRLPLFLGPDGVDTVYVSVDNGPVTAVYSRVDDRLDQIEGRLDAAEDQWLPYTPAWTSSGGNAPTLGNGLLEGRYHQIGKTMLVRGRLVLGSTSGVGGGGWQVSLPPVTIDTAAGKAVGSLFLFQPGQPVRPGICATLDTTLWLVSGTGGEITPTNPYPWTTDGELHWSIAVNVL